MQAPLTDKETEGHAAGTVGQTAKKRQRDRLCNTETTEGQGNAVQTAIETKQERFQLQKNRGTEKQRNRKTEIGEQKDWDMGTERQTAGAQRVRDTGILVYRLMDLETRIETEE